MLPESETEIQALLGNGDRFSEAERYYDSGGVRAIGVASEREIVARVAAGRNKTLQLRIELGNGSTASSEEAEAPTDVAVPPAPSAGIEPSHGSGLSYGEDAGEEPENASGHGSIGPGRGLASSCDCGQPPPCEHVGAVLLTLLREEIPVKPGTRWGGHIAGLSESRQRSSAQPPRAAAAAAPERHRETVELDDGNVTEIEALSVLEALAQIDNGTTQSSAALGKRYKLAFVLEREADEGWSIRAALRYLRQDGTGGSLVNFAGNRITEFVPPEERALLGAIVGGATPEEGPYRAPLAGVLPQLSRSTESEIYLAREGAASPAEAQRSLFREVSVTFVVEAFVPAPRFAPRVSLHCGESGPTQLEPGTEIVAGGGTVACIVPDRGQIALSEGETPGLAELLPTILRSSALFAYGDVVRLHRVAQAVAPGNAAVHLPPPRIEFRKLTPTPILYLDREWDGTSARLTFAYRSGAGTGESAAAPGGGADIAERAGGTGGGAGAQAGDTGTTAESPAAGAGADAHAGPSDTSAGEEISEVGSNFANRYENDVLAVSRRNTQAEAKLHRRFRTVAARLEPGAFPGAATDLPANSHAPSSPLGERIHLDHPLDTVLHEVAVPLLQEGWRVAVQRRPVRRMSQSLRFSISGSGTDWFDLKPYVIDSDGEIRWVDLSDASIQQGLIATSAGYSLLTREDIELLNDFNEYPSGKNGAVRVKSFDLGAVAAVANRADHNEAFERTRSMVASLSNAPEQREIELPEWFGGTLRSYQLAGTSWLDRLYQFGLSGCLADDMGLGKTIQALAFLSIRKAAGELGTCLIVVPVSTIGNWRSEIEKFAPRLTAHVHAGPDRMRSIDAQREADLTIISYETLLQDVETFAEHSFSFLIIDESQRIKNAGTQTYRAVKQMSANMRIALTGTPVENTTLELWSLMNLLLPGLLGSRSRFLSNYGAPIEKQNDTDASRRLRRLVGPFVLRRRKEDVAEQLPPREEIELVVEMSDRQRELYEQLREHYRAQVRAAMEQRKRKAEEAGIADSGGAAHDEPGAGTTPPESGTSATSARGGSESGASNSHKILEGLLRLRQAALFPDLLDEAYNGYPSCKQEVLLEQIEPLVQEGHKALVFSQFVSVLSRLETTLSKAGINSVYLDGSTRNRQTVIDRFQNDSSVSVFLISLRAGGVGINLTAADYVYLFDPWWNPAVESQAIDRTHRIGQTRHVIAYRLIAKDTVEEKILNLQKRKRELSSSITPSDQDIVQSLTQEELAELFEP